MIDSFVGRGAPFDALDVLTNSTADISFDDPLRGVKRVISTASVAMDPPPSSRPSMRLGGIQTSLHRPTPLPRKDPLAALLTPASIPTAAESGLSSGARNGHPPPLGILSRQMDPTSRIATPPSTHHQNINLRLDNDAATSQEQRPFSAAAAAPLSSSSAVLGGALAGYAGSEWGLLGKEHHEASYALDRLYFDIAAHHFLDFSDSIGTLDSRGSPLPRSEAHMAMYPPSSASLTPSLHALQSRLLHQLRLIDIPDLELAAQKRGGKGWKSSATNNHLLRAILNGRQAQNTEIYPVALAGGVQPFECSFCGFGSGEGDHGGCVMLLDARYHGSSGLVDHCPECGMFQRA